MYEGADQSATAVHVEIARGPHRRRADIGGEDGIIRRMVADNLCQILRMDWFAARRALGERVHQEGRHQQPTRNQAQDDQVLIWNADPVVNHRRSKRLVSFRASRDFIR